MKIISLLIFCSLVGVDGFFISPQRAIKKGCIKKQILKTIVGGAVKKNVIKKSIIKKKRKNILKKALLPAVVSGAVVGGAAVTAGGMLCAPCTIPLYDIRYLLTYLNISPLNPSRCRCCS